MLVNERSLVGQPAFQSHSSSVSTVIVNSVAIGASGPFKARKQERHCSSELAGAGGGEAEEEGPPLAVGDPRDGVLVGALDQQLVAVLVDQGLDEPLGELQVGDQGAVAIDGLAADEVV